MKKMMKDKSFWVILISSIVVLVALTVGVIFLTGRNNKEFYSAGYIINSTVTKSDRYYFDDNTVYRENVFNEYVFTDVDNNEVTTSKDNFIHYLDESLSFMKNGVILDLDNFNQNVVPYYNITDKSLIKYNNGGYYIETADKTLVFGNFLGRITDNKYIVVGKDISVRLAGNDKAVKGNYFEILFVEDGIVKVENQEGSYQTVADGTIISVGDNIEINLGNKAVSYDEEIKLTLGELTIDGNENIDIVPEGLINGGSGGSGDGTGEGDGTGSGGGSGDGTGSGGGSGDGNGSGTGDGNGTGTGDGDGNGEGDGNGTGDGSGSGSGETTTILKKEVSVTLTDISTDINSLSAKFQVIDTMEAIKGNLVLSVVNTDTGKTVYTKILANTPEEQLVVINTLTSDSNYVMTVVDENNEISTQYFQKSFRTESLNLRLKRELVTENSLTYSLDFGVNSDIDSADVTLYDKNNEEIYRHTIENDDDTMVSFEGLTNNTLYNVKVDNVVIGNVLYADIYTSNTSDYTLKVKPTLGDIYVKTNDDVKTFTLSMSGVTDDDSAIVKYNYEIYSAEDLTEENLPVAKPVYTFSRYELENQIVSLDEAKGLYGNKDYAFKIVAQYYDNYRYNEISTMMSDYFQIQGKPTISFEATEIGIGSIAGIVTIEDADCTIPYKGRQCFDKDNTFTIRYYGGTTSNRNEITNVKFNPDKMTLDFELDGLTENTLYTFEVYADVDFKNGAGLQTSQYIGGFNASTKGVAALKIQNWESYTHSYENPISLSAEMVSTSPEDTSIDSLASITFKLFSGEQTRTTVQYEIPIATLTVKGNIKDIYYNKRFDVKSSMFEYTYVDPETEETIVAKVDNLSILKELSGGRLSKKYTIQITDAMDESGFNKFPIVGEDIYIYNTPSILLLEDQVATPEIIVEEITNIQTKAPSIDDKGIYEEEFGITYTNLLNDEIIRGYKVIVKFDAAKIEQFIGGNSIIKVNYYVNDSLGNLIETRVIDFSELSDEFLNQEYITYFWVGDGTDYNIIDEELRRGNKYIFSFDLNIDDDSDISTPDLIFPASRPTFDAPEPIKQVPEFRMYVDSSTENSVTYKYQIKDPDNALYMEDEKYYLYYNVSGSEEGYVTEYVKDGSSSTFTLDNLSNGSIYEMLYFSAITKTSSASKISIGNYYFDGYYNADDYDIKYRLVYGNFDNRLKIIFEDNEFLNRVSSYLVTLEAEGQKYQQVISDLEMCNEEEKCIIVDYAKLVTDEINFKNKNITVTVDAFYDTGYAGFGQVSLIGDYFKNLNLVDEENASKVGYVYQLINASAAGKYFYNTGTEFKTDFDLPRGIHGFEIISTEKLSDRWQFNTSNLLDILNNKFVNYGELSLLGVNVITKPSFGSITIENENLTFVPKVLNVVNTNTDNNSFKFTSIIPKTSATNTPMINGTIFNFNLSIDSSTMETDFVKTDGKYKFYVDIYEEQNVCTEVEVPSEPVEGEDGVVEGDVVTEEVCTVEKKLIKTVETDYDSLSNVVVDGLKPNSMYYYKISADMNKNGEKVKTPLFRTGSGYVEFEASFNTLGVKGVFNKVNYSYDSFITTENYSNRELTIKSLLNNTINYDLRYQIFEDSDEEENGKKIVFESIIENEDIDANKKIATYVYDMTGDNYVFGPNYYTLVITAITDDENKYELELLNEKLVDDAINGKYFGVLRQATFNISQSAGIDEDYSYYITSDIIVKDEYKVIDDNGNKGKIYIDLQDSSDKFVCKGGKERCSIEVQLKTGTAGDVHVCNYENSMATDCVVSNLGNSGDQFKVSLIFDDLKPNTAYSTYVHTNVYMNNVSLTEDAKRFEAYARKTQFTKSALDFSIGSVSPEANASNKSQVSITFVGASNLEKTLVGIDYNVHVEGQYMVDSGSLGITPSGDSGRKLQFVPDVDGFPTLTIKLNTTVGKELGANNYITLTYYYKDSDGNIVALKIGEETSYRYDFPLKG